MILFIKLSFLLQIYQLQKINNNKAAPNKKLNEQQVLENVRNQWETELMEVEGKISESGNKRKKSKKQKNDYKEERLNLK